MEMLLRLQTARARVEITKLPKKGAAQYDTLMLKMPGYLPGPIKDELKMMANARWNPEKTAWTMDDTQRTAFTLALLRGENPYAPYDTPIPDYDPFRKCMYGHQRKGTGHMIERRGCIVAAEMGTGKTLMSIEAIEKVAEHRIWWVAPKSALYSVQLDFHKWNAKIIPLFMTYEGLVKKIENWTPGDKAPFGVFFDEASRCKNPESKRAKCARHLGDAIREYTAKKGFVVLLSGSPAPKSPLDWWMLGEIASPGYFREGNIHKFRDRTAIVKMEESLVSNAKYPKIITFRDNPLKCGACGKLKAEDIHNVSKDDLAFNEMIKTAGVNDNHEYVPTINEIENLHKRMNGLTYAILKKDCLDLPEKIYHTIELTPTKYVLALAKMIVKTARSTAQALISLRELSDGFQYYEKKIGDQVCEHCGGSGKGLIDTERNTCVYCSGRGTLPIFETSVTEIPTPKDDALKDLLDLKEEDGRMITYAGFTGSIDKICRLTVEAGWKFIRVDGKGWQSTLDVKDPKDMLGIFQDTSRDDKINFIAHPKSAGMGLTLTASDTTLYYSNDFDGESRVQSEDRNHRIGTRGCNIYDLFHLPVDQLVLKNLKTKRKLELMTLGELDDCIPEA